MWSEFESEVIEGRYPLGRLVRSEGRCGWFETKFDDKPAIISVIESINDETALLDRLRAAEKVHDRNVAAIFAAGAGSVRETPLVYAVMEHTEESLDDVLRARSLSADETRDVAESLLNALRAIHRERLVCSRLEAAGVLAAGDTIKLRSDSLQLVPPGTAFESYAAKDIRDLGSLLHQCLTQRPLKPSTDANDPSLQLLPAPFAKVVRRTLGGAPTLDEIAALLHPAPAVAAVPVAPPPAPTPKPAAVPAGAPRLIEPAKAQDKEQIKPKDVPLLEDSPRKTLPGNLPWLIAGFVALLVIVGFVLHAFLSRPDRAEKRQVIVSAETVPPRPSTAAPTPAPKPASAAPAKAAPVSSSAGNWRVVAFTYNREDQAAHKAQTVNERHPDLQAGVFSPKGSGAPFLVTLGAPTDRASAFRLKERAIAEGLPRDTYAQNYTH